MHYHPFDRTKWYRIRVISHWKVSYWPSVEHNDNPNYYSVVFLTKSLVVFYVSPLVRVRCFQWFHHHHLFLHWKNRTMFVLICDSLTRAHHRLIVNVNAYQVIQIDPFHDHQPVSVVKVRLQQISTYIFNDTSLLYFVLLWVVESLTFSNN